MKKFFSWLSSFVKWLGNILSSEKTSEYIELVEKTVENSEIINNSKYQNIIIDVISTIKGAVRYSLKTDDEKKTIITNLVVEKLETTKIKISKDVIQIMVNLLFDRVEEKLT